MVAMWYEVCLNPAAMTHLYEVPPPLDRVEVHEVILHRDGPRLTLRIELPAFPDNPPPRWPEGANAAQVTLDLWGVSGFEQKGWGLTNRGALALGRNGDSEITFSFESESAYIRGKCEMARISRVSAYVKGAAA